MSKNSEMNELDLVEEEVKDEAAKVEVQEEKAEVPATTTKSKLTETVVNTIKTVVSQITIPGVSTMANAKWNLTTYLRKCPQNTYVEAYLKAFFKSKAMTKEEWDQVVEDFLNMTLN